MHPETRDISNHMFDFSLSILGRAIYDVTFAEMERAYIHALAVIQAAHGTEIMIKARIAQEHPLLIFTKIPSLNNAPDLLSIGELFEYGRSAEYDELPNLLWAVTGYRMNRQDEYRAFGRLRNKIMHFAVPQMDYPNEVLKFCMEVVEPMVNDFWEDSILPYAEVWDETILSDGYLAQQIAANKIELTALTRKVLREKSYVPLDSLITSEDGESS